MMLMMIQALVPEKLAAFVGPSQLGSFPFSRIIDRF
jgi:hypothetical protein